MLRVLFILTVVVHCLQEASLKAVNRTRFMNVTDTCTCGTTLSHRIINGQIAGPHAYPWMVAIRTWKNKRSYNACGGTLINDRYILTAAHCAYGFNKDRVEVRLGTDKATRSKNETAEGYIRKIKRIQAHPDFLSLNNFILSHTFNDIALMELDEPIGHLNHVGQICLPLGKGEEKLSDYEAKVTGWGVMEIKVENGSEVNYSSHLLQETVVKVLSNDDCEKMHEGHEVIPDSFICALGENSTSCRGDSGGPLFVERSGRYEQIGVVSWGPRECLKPNRPGVYTRVSEFVDWIIKHTQNAVYCS